MVGKHNLGNAPQRVARARVVRKKCDSGERDTHRSRSGGNRSQQSGMWCPAGAASECGFCFPKIRLLGK
ncbi:MAG: hypothetical protein ACXVGI_09805, partial [Mycobacteriaceae bacterium]